MNAVMQTHHHYAAEFERVESVLAGAALPWLREQRREAIAAFAARGFPTPRDEDWKYTRTTPVEKRAFTLAPTSAVMVDAQRLQQVLHSEFADCRLVFINGRYRPEWSRLDGLPAKVRVSSLATALNKDAAELRAAFNKGIELQRHPFALLNSAFADDGAFIVLEKGAVLEQPLQLVFVSTAAQDGHATYPRIVVSAADNSQATIIERFVALDEASYFTNVVTAVALGKNAGVEYCRLQEESAKAIHISGVFVAQENDSRFTSHAISLGGLLTRNDVDVQLAAPGVECTLNGLYMAGGRQHVDTHTRIDHLQPHGTSHEFYKGVLDGHGRGVFNGKVIVHPDAQKTDARQRNQNLLLSDDAEADTKPELEIYADDVKCAHGATVGQLDADSVFYLRSRGIDERAARSLLTYAFASEIIERVQLPAIRAYLQQAVLARLPGGPAIKEFL